MKTTYDSFVSQRGEHVRETCLVCGPNGLELRAPSVAVMNKHLARMGESVLNDRMERLGTNLRAGKPLTREQADYLLMLVGRLDFQRGGLFRDAEMFTETTPEHRFPAEYIAENPEIAIHFPNMTAMPRVEGGAA